MPQHVVYSMGTENRAAPEEFIPPQERPYDYIVFRAAEVQNLALDVDPRPAPHAGFNDPAVLSVSHLHLFFESRGAVTLCANFKNDEVFRM